VSHFTWSEGEATFVFPRRTLNSYLIDTFFCGFDRDDNYRIFRSFLSLILVLIRIIMCKLAFRLRNTHKIARGEIYPANSSFGRNHKGEFIMRGSDQVFFLDIQRYISLARNFYNGLLYVESDCSLIYHFK